VRRSTGSGGGVGTASQLGEGRRLEGIASCEVRTNKCGHQERRGCEEGPDKSSGPTGEGSGGGTTARLEAEL